MSNLRCLDTQGAGLRQPPQRRRASGGKFLLGGRRLKVKSVQRDRVLVTGTSGPADFKIWGVTGPTTSRSLSEDFAAFAGPKPQQCNPFCTVVGEARPVLPKNLEPEFFTRTVCNLTECHEPVPEEHQEAFTRLAVCKW